MPNLGRCGRQRRRKDRDGFSQNHFLQFIVLMKWMKKNKGIDQVFSHTLTLTVLEPAEFKETGRGLRCKRKISPGDVIVSIPASLLITPHTVLKSRLGILIARSELQFSPQQLLSMFLIIEQSQSDSSEWKPYLNSLPEVYSTPIYFSDGELNLLSPRVHDLALKSRERFERACDRILDFLRAEAPSYLETFNAANLQWAWCSVNTRSVYLKTAPHPSIALDPEESHVALAPFLDLLNHKDSAKISAGMSEDGSSYDIVSFDKYNRYKQVFINYGPHDNVKLFVEYGFTLPSNSNNCYVFSLDTVCHHCASEKHGKPLLRKQEILKQAGFDRQLVCTQDGVSWSLMTSIKILILSWDDLSRWKQLVQSGWLSDDNTQRAATQAWKLLTDALLKCRRHLEEVIESPQTDHKDLLVNLAQDDVDILEHSLSLLNSQRDHLQT